MVDFFIKYWVEVLFGAITAGLVAFFKYFWKLVKNEYERQRKELLEVIEQRMTEQKEAIITSIDERESKLLEADNNMERQLEEMYVNNTTMKTGILSLQGRIFKRECRQLLEPEHIITLQEYEAICAEHITYNSLGGNHQGDALFAMVEQKYKNILLETLKTE